MMRQLQCTSCWLHRHIGHVNRYEGAEWCCRLEDLPAAVEVADGMLEHLNQLQAGPPLECFQALGLDEALLARAEPDTAGTLSDAACMAYLRSAVL